MIDIELVREKPEWVRERVETKGDEAPVDRILELDARRREIIVEADALRARRNLVSREIGQLKDRPPQELIEEMREVGSKVKDHEAEQRSVDAELNELLLAVPNPPADDVPIGEDDADNPEVRRVGELPSFDFDPQAHWELGRAAGHNRLRTRRKAGRVALFHPEGQGRQASESVDLMDGKPAHGGARIRGVIFARHGEP